MSRMSVSASPPSDRDDPGYAYSVRPAAPPSRPGWLVTAWDGETGTPIGRCEIASSAGATPVATPRDLLERMGGRYRLEAVRVDCALDRLSVVTRRVARACARHRRAGRRWRRATPTG
ncbi:hypothetical protein PQJ75_10520 [Rhodoplanes sp. TEM]|uniref:Uncharacterized protein n=1 Tax=Rhodoplanes tepidamans TaxID=200616 RepID=A0ABT5JGU7_RHOTP|nr:MULTISPECIES: hypothetical protein [Rhodoplanes]MDC7788509.1 hypothetical protein [Rhodoplanes tepidamans]MDC7984163.1 hypothetical protein [Rhodoplanes sp. TEM]MDQ0356857.1 hypothetical protein [Rhodoplanes tepidamans]